ncbi:MAG TPA: glycosyltransferase family 2 protein [Vicinamibacterales bacterium]|nr:glycosyltransferase family 2 protein [Vicinamibacterales bacterium]
MAEPSTVSIVIPAFNEERAIGEVVTHLRAAAPWREILVIDDGSADATAARAAEAGACVIRHPYNKGNGAAVKTGIRHAQGEFVLIIDADGQHQPADACRIVARLGEYDLVVGARDATTQATVVRRHGNEVLNALAGYLTGRPIPDLTSGFRGARREHLREFLHLLPNGFSTPTTTTLAFIRAGYNVMFEPIAARRRLGQSKIKLTRDGASFFLILLKVITIFSPLRVFVPVSASSFAIGTLYGIGNFVSTGRIPNGAVILILFAALVFLVGLVSEQVASLRFDGHSRD